MPTDVSSLLLGTQCYVCYGATVEDALELSLLNQISNPGTSPPFPVLTATGNLISWTVTGPQPQTVKVQQSADGISWQTFVITLWSNGSAVVQSGFFYRVIGFNPNTGYSNSVGIGTNSLLFDGTTDLVTVADFTTGLLSVMAWVQSTGNFGAFRDVMSQAGGAGTDWAFALQLNTLDKLESWVSINGQQGQIQGSGSSITLFNAGTSGTFFHVAMTYDGTLIKIFVNGLKESSANVSGGGNIHDAAQPICIGRFGQGGDFFAGTIAGPRIYNRALSEAEVLQCTGDKLGAPSITNGMLMWLPFSGKVGVSAVGATLNDNSGNGNNGTGAGNAGTLTFQQISV